MTKAKTPTKITDVKEARERKKSDASKKQQSPPESAPESQKPTSTSSDAPKTDGLRDAIASFHLEVIENAWQHRTEFAKCQRASCVAMRARLKR